MANKFGDTPQNFEENLCDKCKWAVIVTGTQYKNKIYYCNKIGEKLRFNVNECNSFQKLNSPTLFDMNQIAWKVVADKKTKKIGFMSPSQAWVLIKAGTHEELGNGINDD